MKNTSFRCLWIGQAFANLGDIFYVVGLISLLYNLTGSALYLSLLPFITTIFRFISSLLAPLVIDRFPLKRIIVQSQWWKTVLLVCLGIFIISFNHGFSVAVIFFIALISLLDGVAAPVSAALVPQLVPKEERMKANGFLNVITQTIFVAGWPLGSVLLISTNSSFIIWLTVMLYAVSTIYTGRIKDPEQTTAPVAPSNWGSIKSGWVAIRQIPTIRTLISIDFITTLASSVWVAAVLYIYVEQNLQLGEEWWGYINTSYFVGMILSGLIVIRFAKLLEKHIGFFITLGLFLSSLLILLFGTTSIPTLALLLACLYGLPEQIREVIYTKLFQDHATEKTLAKIYAVWGAVINLTFAGSVLLLGFITETYSVKTTFQFSSTLIFLAFLYAIFKRNDLQGKQCDQSLSNQSSNLPG
ncbi:MULTISPECIES: MFS transporter [unclassified Bacillus (in: firmicutes)]|uniref:MFS transporter n=1 Tax=unclassified Bacillus (in: firmicutes) TaxID=185979 RepID=UPI001BECBBA1|nr:MULTISPECIES: MFS transporter [unclassified Bacillus (in: firmicutes)]MBT2618571.1 MFS transporter [Bacillus sp. ISL-78]MBT2629170.1 MFS transporter [Bacillus sp. ISL-101]MBT2717325.1 MFS transporter [Bacillus sp. ISL-57]